MKSFKRAISGIMSVAMLLSMFATSASAVELSPPDGDSTVVTPADSQIILTQPEQSDEHTLDPPKLQYSVQALDSSDTNLALNKPVKARNQNQNFPASYAVDGIHTNSNSWRAAYGAEGYNPTEWFTVDLGEVCNISKIDIHFDGDNRSDGRKFQYKVYTSTADSIDDFFVDSEGYKGAKEKDLNREKFGTPVVDGSQNTEIRPVHTFEQPIQARHIVVDVIGSTTTNGNKNTLNAAIWELEVYGTNPNEPEEPDEPTETNIALHKPVTARSENANFRAKNVTDGVADHSHSWRSYGTVLNHSEWAAVNLGDICEIDRIEIYLDGIRGGSDLNERHHYKIYAIKDGDLEDYLLEPTDGGAGKQLNTNALQDYLVADGSENKEVHIVHNFDEPIQASYIIVDDFDVINTTNQTPKDRNAAIFELEVYGTEPEQDPNLAKGKPTTASTAADEHTAALATDGDEATYWASKNAAKDEWLQVDLRMPRTFNRVDLKWADNSQVDYTIEVSDDKTTWKPVFVRGDRAYADKESFQLITEQTARYVRIRADKVTNAFALKEFELYRDDDFKDRLQMFKDKLDAGEVAPALNEDNTALVIPEAPEGITLAYGGTDYEQVIDADGRVKTPLVDTEVGVELKLYPTLDPNNYKLYEFFLTVPGKFNSEESINEKPTVLPELQQWFGQEGNFSITENSKIIVDSGLGSEYVDMAKIFAEDYKDITGNAIEVVRGAKENAQAGDFYFAESENNLDKETYDMIIGDFVTVEANHQTGAYWSTRTILQILKQNGTTIPKGLVRDYPKFEVRGFMFDVARLPIPFEFVQMLTKQMSWYKMNDLNLHLTDSPYPLDDYGFRLESKQVKGYKSVDKDGVERENAEDLTNKDVFYTKDEFRQLQIDSKQIGVNIVPEFDTPGHSYPFARTRPWLARGPEGKQDFHYIDAANPDTLAFVKEVFSEYMEEENPVFLEDTVVHIGTDEYKGGNQADKEAFRAYQDALLKFIRDDMHRTPRVWGSQTENSGTTPITAEGVQMYMWYKNYANPKEMYDKGYDMINIDQSYVYMTPQASYPDRLNKNTILNRWSPEHMMGLNLPAGDPQVLGGSYALWNDMSGASRDIGITEIEMFDRIFDILPTFSERVWSNCNDYTVEDITRLEKVTKYAPNTNPYFEVESNGVAVLDYEFYEGAETKDTSLNGYDIKGAGVNTAFVEGRDGKALQLNGGESYVETPIDNMGFNSTLDFWVKRDADSGDDEQILFESTLYGKYPSAIKAVQKDTGKFGFSRDFRDYSFNYTLPKDEWVHITMVMEMYKTTLFVNGEKVDILEMTKINGKRNGRWATVIMPLARIGSETKAFKGQLDGIVMYNIAETSGTLPHAPEPVIVTQPQAQTVVEGETATFTVAATGDELTYQWQRQNGDAYEDIAGAVDASYTLKAELADNGVQFRCLITNTVLGMKPTSVISESAMLNVDKKSSSGGGGGGAVSTDYVITASAGVGGSISPNGSVKVTKGTDKTFTIKASDGFVIEDVLVDGKSVGAVSTYTFEKVNAKHTIQATFAKQSSDANPFTDIDGHWGKDVILEAVDKGLFSGTSATTFTPDGKMTRAMLVTVLYRMAGEPEVTEESGFVDVPADAYYADAVAWAIKKGITKGVGDNKFAPNDYITREQMACFLYAYDESTPVSADALKAFTDEASISHWAREAMNWAVSEGLISGKGNSLLDPIGGATRAEVASILVRYLSK